MFAAHIWKSGQPLAYLLIAFHVRDDGALKARRIQIDDARCGPAPQQGVIEIRARLRSITSLPPGPGGRRITLPVSRGVQINHRRARSIPQQRVIEKGARNILFPISDFLLAADPPPEARPISRRREIDKRVIRTKRLHTPAKRRHTQRQR
jgi:hypothetical protein